MINNSSKKHYIAIIGGSISGSEAAFILAEKGYRVVVFEMKDLPYGKIEDGLPLWHVNLRNKQERNIDKNLDHDNIRYVPNVKIGTDISFEDLVKNWGFTVVIVANGAWRDRELPVTGIEKFIDKQLVYQNALLFWYNHKHELTYNGTVYEIKDGTVVVGGGLASLDVMKLGMIELVQKALLKHKGLEVDVFTLERTGIASFLKGKNIAFDELQLEGMTLVYRRTAFEMPLKMPNDDSAESIEKARVVSNKLLQKYAENFFFKFIPLASPIAAIEKDDVLQSVVFQRNRLENGKLIPVKDETLTVKTPMLISSIGSLPEEINGLPYAGATLKMVSENGYRVTGFSNVFAIGNAVTGKGNIQDSKSHGSSMTNKIIDEHLQSDDLLEEWLQNINTNLKIKVNEQIDVIDQAIQAQKIMPDHLIENILNRTKELQQKTGFTTYKEWIALKTPIRLEDMLAKKVDK
jgi:NADPH-dependent glutamate synthase beta subunit-like oxidoreductase